MTQYQFVETALIQIKFASTKTTVFGGGNFVEFFQR